jgi:FkbM family methyltransferase
VFWSVVQHVHAISPTVAAVLANIAPERSFSIDADGHWVNRQAEATFVSPDIHAQRLSFVTEKVRDEWFWTYTPGPDDVVFDIGAGIGEEAVVMASMATHVFAIEAHPDTFKCLQETVRLSGLRNVTPIHCAIAREDGQIRIAGAHHLSAAIGDDGALVQQRSLKSLCDELGIKQIDFLKMNIEGAEKLAVQGFGELAIRNLVIACHDFIPGIETKHFVRNALRRMGYSVKDRPHERPWTKCNLYARK